MDHKEIARRIAALSDEQRDELYRLCETRKRKNKGKVSAVVYEQVTPDIAEVLKDQKLVWDIWPSMAAAREHVYAYWLKHVDALETEAAD